MVERAAPPPRPSVYQLHSYLLAPWATGLGRGGCRLGAHLGMCGPKSRAQRSRSSTGVIRRNPPKPGHRLQQL